MKLPIYDIQINEEEDSFVSAVALVENPAIESNFIAFNSVQNFSINDENRELLGFALIPEKPIFRTSPKGDYYVSFSKDTIRKIAQVFAKKGLFNNTNIEHSIIPADSYIFQSYIVDDSKGITAPKNLKGGGDGSLVIGVKVENDDVWQNIKNGSLTGFSVEGIFQLFPTEQTFNSEDFELEQAIKEFNSALEKLNKQNCSK